MTRKSKQLEVEGARAIAGDANVSACLLASLYGSNSTNKVEYSGARGCQDSLASLFQVHDVRVSIPAP